MAIHNKKDKLKDMIEYDLMKEHFEQVNDWDNENQRNRVCKGYE